MQERQAERILKRNLTKQKQPDRFPFVFGNSE